MVEYDEKKLEELTKPSAPKVNKAEAPQPSYEEVLALREEEAMFKSKENEC